MFGIMQVLCIETTINPMNNSRINKGDIYTSINLSPIGVFYRNVDNWHTLEEILPDDRAHVSLFIDLPSQEGQSFSKKVEKPELETA